MDVSDWLEQPEVREQFRIAVHKAADGLVDDVLAALYVSVLEMPHNPPQGYSEASTRRHPAAGESTDSEDAQ